MSEIFSSVRLKEKVLIIVLTLVAAIFVGVIAGAVTFATTDRHIHEYEYHLERGADGAFDFVGVCTYEGCTNPRYVQNIISGVTNKVKTPATCTTTGVMEFYFTYAGDYKTYTYTEELPMEPHTYTGELVTEDGVTSFVGSCVYDGCDAPEISIEGATDLKLEYILDGSCSSPKREMYSYQLGGEKHNITIQSETNAPHKLNGKFITEYEIEDGVYLYGTEGIVLVGVPALGCGNKAPGYFICQDCKKPVAVMVGKPDHTFEVLLDTVNQPTTLAEGSVTLSCTADGCDQTKRLTLPRAVVDENSSVVERNCAIGRQVLDYVYTPEELGVTVSLRLTLPWNEHNYQYVESETNPPSLVRDGYAVVRCTAEGCTSSNRIVLRKINLDDPELKNAEVISEATELSPKKVLYTFVSDTYGFTVNLEIPVGDVLTHNYVYALEPVSSDDPSAMLTFDLVGRCHQPECVMPEIREKNVEVTSRDTSTCQTPGELIYTHVTESGEEYSFSMFIGLGSHNLVVLNKVHPDLSNEGSVTIGCTHEGCPYAEVVITLPKVDFATNSTMRDDGKVSYMYYYEPLDYYVALTLTFTVSQE